MLASCDATGMGKDAVLKLARENVWKVHISSLCDANDGAWEMVAFYPKISCWPGVIQDGYIWGDMPWTYKDNSLESWP